MIRIDLAVAPGTRYDQSVDVVSDSVDPTIGNGSTVLVDHQHDELMHDRIFAVRTGSVVLVKRTVDEDGD